MRLDWASQETLIMVAEKVAEKEDTNLIGMGRRRAGY
jgi:hypothetical protein